MATKRKTTAQKRRSDATPNAGSEMATAIATTAEPYLRNIIISIHDDVSKSTKMGEIEVAIRTKKLTDAFAKTKAREVEGLTRPQVERAVEGVVRQSIPTALNITDRRLLTVAEQAANHAKKFSAAHLTGVSRETQLAVRNIVAYGMLNGHPPRTIARQLRDGLGLTAPHQRAVQNYRANLLSAGKMPKAQVDAMTTMYAQRLKEFRAQMIARTEVMNALNIGRLTVWRKAQQLGHVPPSATKRWLTAEDERTCPICAPLHGVEVGLNERFVVPIPNKQERMVLDGPPPHPQCRCLVELVT